MNRIEPIHPWRWRALVVWIVLFTLTTGYGFRVVKHDAARVSQLEHTNCSLKNFLIIARNTRLEVAKHLTGQVRSENIAAAKGYAIIADRITAVGNNCKLPKKERL